MDILDGLRIFFGSVFILFLPGFTWSFVFFEKGKIDWIERMALSFGLSVALVPLTVFWFNFLFHIKITLLNTALVVCALAAAPTAYLIIKRYFIPVGGLKAWFRSALGAIIGRIAK